MFRLTAVLRLQACSGWIGPRRSAWPLPPSPQPSPSERGAGFVFRLTAVLRLHVFGMDRAMPISLPLPPTPALSLRGGGWSVFHLTAVLRLQVCSGSIGPSRSACPFPLTPTSPSGRGGWFCVSADSCVAFTGVFGIDRATPISLASSPLTPTLPLRERGLVCVSPDSCVAFTGMFGWFGPCRSACPFPHPSPLPRGARDLSGVRRKSCPGRRHRMYTDLETGHRPVPSPPWGEG